MEQIVTGLYASPPEPLSFAPDIHIRAFLIRHAGNNLLVYANGRAMEVANDIEAFGGVDQHVLTHWHEAAMDAAAIAQRFGAPVHCHVADRGKVEEQVEVAGSFDSKHMFAEGIEIIPIPGHTPGATAVLWHGPEHRCLFTGDSLFASSGEWRAALLESSDRTAYLDSLRTIGELDFDLLVPWVAPVGADAAAPASRAVIRHEIDAVIDRIRGGGDS